MLLQVLGIIARNPLLLDLLVSFGRGHNAPKRMERIHIEGHIVQFAFVIGHRRVNEVIELAEPGKVVPYLTVACSKNMSAVSMDIDTLDFLCITVASDMVAPLDNKNLLACVKCLSRHDGPEQPASNDQQIVLATHRTILSAQPKTSKLGNAFAHIDPTASRIASA